MVALAAGSYHSCALIADGSVRCWGGNGHGQLGDGTTTTRLTATTVTGLTGLAVTNLRDFGISPSMPRMYGVEVSYKF